MLRVTKRGVVGDVTTLSPQEDGALRRAFGRFHEPEARQGGAAVVQRYQRFGAGCWFLCDCLGDVDRPPALVPVSEAHIRRHRDAPWPEHDQDCDFYRYASEQRTVSKSYRRMADRRKISLLARLREDEQTGAVRLTSRNFGRTRGALATLLMQLIDDAELNHLAFGAVTASLREQYGALRVAARPLEIDDGVSLASFLCTYPPALPDLMVRIGQVSPSRFHRSNRPHGVFISVVADAAVGFLQPLTGAPIPVRGEIAVFGEQEGHSRQSLEERRARSPYLAICIVGRPDPSSPVQVLKAYLHPCVSVGHLMPVDSNLERHTLKLVTQLRSWMTRKKNIVMSITKPVFDISPAQKTGGDEVHEPCIPDYILKANSVPAGGSATVIVECMGYADAGYRQRKHRTHPIMSNYAGGAPIVLHDFHDPSNLSQEARDRKAWLECRWAITGLSEETM
jgi:hypothetical protein